MRGLLKGLFGKMFLLKTLRKIEVKGVTTFIAAEKFCEYQTVDGVRISQTGRNFKENLLDKKETSVAGTMLRIQELNKKSPNELILKKLNGTHEALLAYIWEVLKEQGSGEKGDLLVDGGSNIAYAYGLILHFKWDLNYDGWYCGALHPSDKPRWSKGSRVLSHCPPHLLRY